MKHIIIPISAPHTHVEEASTRLVNVAPSSSTNQPTQLPVHILRLPQVMAQVGLKHTTIYQRIADGSFPRPIPLGIRARGWIESEVTTWINARIEKRAEGLMATASAKPF